MKTVAITDNEFLKKTKNISKKPSVCVLSHECVYQEIKGVSAAERRDWKLMWSVNVGFSVGRGKLAGLGFATAL